MPILWVLGNRILYHNTFFNNMENFSQWVVQSACELMRVCVCKRERETDRQTETERELSSFLAGNALWPCTLLHFWLPWAGEILPYHTLCISTYPKQAKFCPLSINLFGQVTFSLKYYQMGRIKEKVKVTSESVFLPRLIFKERIKYSQEIGGG